MTTVSTHSHPKVAALGQRQDELRAKMFQHTATRRWLHRPLNKVICARVVSTHSHPKVAALMHALLSLIQMGFNTQPPEGGCITSLVKSGIEFSFNTQPPEGGCSLNRNVLIKYLKFQHTATRRWLHKEPKMEFKSYQVSTHSHPKVAATF